ncbi:MAG TPA: DDE-type integrase/transposase/recombinase [Opitutaceae bacterium]|jgi:IS1 family transposase|nr:DDE-type integrase/transposase/recombinase [Opitutaceae bacterium]
MNKTTAAKRAQVLMCLVEGNSMRATSRLTGVAKNTVVKLLAEVGRACSEYQDKAFRSLTCKRIQCDEVWSFVGAKEKNTTKETKARGWGDCWTWTALDAETKLIPCWYVGTRDGDAAYHFMHDLAARLAHRVQLTTDGHKPYLTAVADAFGTDIDYAQLVKIYGEGPKTEARYSPAQCMGARVAVINGKPEHAHVSTSYIERSNLSLRMGNRRFTRLTNAFSKKVENHEHMLALFFCYYNFCRIHQSLRVTPAMQAGISNHVWEIEEIISLLGNSCEKAA